MKTTGVILGALLAWSLTAAGSPPLQPVADPAPILHDLQRKMSSLHSVYFAVSQERHLQLFTDPLKSEGAMLIDHPDQIRWETSSPYRSILLGDHDSVAQFEFTDGKWNRLKLGFPQMLKRVMEQMSLMNQGKLDALTADYQISVATGDVAVITLVPKDATVRSVLASLEVIMPPDFSATREVVMHEPNGDFTRLVFSREKRNVQFPPGTFDQTKPLDLAVIKAEIGDAP